MVVPFLPPEQVAQLSELVAQYILEQRTRYLPAAISMSVEQTDAMAGFFSTDLLAETRLLVLKRGRVANPHFYPMLMSMGFTNLPDQSAMAAITFVNTIVTHTTFTNELLFHELVHVEQYRQLGVQRFAALYVRGFLHGGGYDGIPLEQNAYRLGAKYDVNPAKPFSVAEVIADWISQDLF